MTFADLWELISYPFVLRALAAGAMVSACAALLGVILVLKRYALIGHGLSEVAFASLSLSMALGLPPLLLSAPLVLAASFAIMYISTRRRMGGDIAIGIASSAALALGVLAASLSSGMNADIYGYMFGSILSMTNGDVILSAVLSLLVGGFILLFRNRLFVIAYNEDYARSLGLNISLYQFLISALTALTVVLGMRMMGTLLISSHIILPAATARRVAGSFGGLLLLAALVSLVCFGAGMLLSILWNLPTGASIVLVNVLAFLSVGAVRRPGSRRS